MVLERSTLDVESLNRLANRDFLAIQIKGYIPKQHARYIGDKILEPGYERYTNAPSIGRIGMAFYEAENEPDLVSSYFDLAKSNISELRSRCAPYSSPIDTLRCELDELWPAGANIETMHGRKMYVGLSRVVLPGVRFLAHHDIFCKDAPDSFKALSLHSQFACNVYLNMPSSGGALQMWKKELTPDEFDELRQGAYGIEPDCLGDPDLQITPESGDLIIFNSKKMHSVTPGSDKPRLSLSCFIGYRGAAEPLTCWS